MKKIIAYIAVLAAFAAVSCNRVEKDFEPMDSSMLTLSLNTSEMSTRASAIPAVEPVVTQLDWFFYPDDSGTSKPKYHGHITVNADKSLGASGTHTPTEAPDVDDDGIIHLGFDLVNTYTGISLGYKVYVLANYPGIDHSNENNLTLQKLLALELDTNFDEKSSGYETINDFVMDSYSGNDEATYPQLIPLTTATTEATDKTTAHVKVELRRVAAKITFTLEISDMLEDPATASLPAAQKTYWSPLTASENYTTYMVNTINHATVAGTPVDAETMAPTLITGSGATGGHQTSYATSHVKTAKDSGTPALKWELDPFYTYPVEFETDSNNAPYLKIALPWQNLDINGNLTDKGTTVYYYKVYIADASGKPLKKFERNKHYVVKLNIKELGGTLEDYVLLTTEFYVADWQAPAEGVYQGYHNPRFLDIARPVYYIYGDNELTVAVTSSHNIKVEIVGVSQTTIKGAPKMSNDDLAALKTNATRPVTVTTDGKVSFKLHYDLDTTLDMTDGASGLPAIYGQMDLSPITWQLKVSHEDLTGYPASYTREVTIIQYPSIYGELNHTNRAQSRFVNEYGTGASVETTTDAWNNHGTSSANTSNTLLDYPTTLGGVRTYNGKSWDKTVLTISTLASFMSSSTTQYNWVLGDPRIRLADSGLYDTAINGTKWGRDDLGTSPNYLDNYLVADPNKGNYIAPRFMITSGLAADASHTNEHWKNAAERCASYQEDGYPAGRWRLPTEAEIEFVIQLENKANSAAGNDNYLDPANVIFHPDHSYWASTGRYYYGKEHKFTESTTVRPSLEPTTSGVAVSNRCVYDLWYWGEEKYNKDGVKITEGVSDTTPAEQWIGFKMD